MTLVEGVAPIVGAKGGRLQAVGAGSAKPVAALAEGRAQVSKLIVASSGPAQVLGRRKNGRGVPGAGQEPSWAAAQNPRCVSWLGSHGVPQIVIREAVARWASVTFSR